MTCREIIDKLKTVPTNLNNLKSEVDKLIN